MQQALIVLGGGVTKDGSVPPWIDARLQHTFDLWQNGNFDYLITSGKGRADFNQTEAQVMAAYLEHRGVPQNRLLTENNSTSTIENAYFCRLQYLDSRGITDVTIVTNEFHSKRAEKIFAFVCGPAYRVTVSPASDVGLPAEAHDVLRAGDLEQADFLAQHIFNAITPGDMAAVKDFIENPANPLANKWSDYKQNSALYKQITELMTK
jgi:uncharacterized SAM-binding protein YcdF (DUF218 family)